MVKNPALNSLKQHPRQRKPRSPVIIGGAPPRYSNVRRIQPPFSLMSGSFRDDQGILDTIYGWPHANDVLVDSSFFSPARRELIRRLLLDRSVLLIPRVQAELNALKSKARGQTLHELVPIIFSPTGEFNQRLECASREWMDGYAYPIIKYLNLLHMRRRVLEKPLDNFEKSKGQRATGKDLSRLQRQLLSEGIGPRTLSLAVKGDPRDSYTDELLSIETVLRPILLGRDCFLLTADRDVFEQTFRLTQLVFDDYGSFLIAQDFARNPDRYTHRHEISTPLMKPGAIAVGRVNDPDYLLPMIFRTCAIHVIDVGTRESFVWVCIHEVEQMLSFQNRSADGRTADGGNGMNVHICFPTGDCPRVQAHFVVGKDHLRKGKIGSIPIPVFDVARALSDNPLSQTVKRRIWIPGRFRV
jgi:hypothetical protein